MQKNIRIILFFWLAGCAGPQTKYEIDADAVEPETRVLSASIDKVWRATQLALAEYPIHVNNQEAGVIETEFIKADQGFKTPGQEVRGARSGKRYHLLVKVYNLAPGKTKVVIRKEVELQRDFFSGREKTPSDGLEELAVMYRLERELNIDKAIEKNSTELDL